jgi:chorismate synthase
MLLASWINPDCTDGTLGQYDTEYHPSSPRNE